MDRFNEKYTSEQNSGCWLWTASCNNCGYGQFRIGKKLVKAHRFSWFLENGDIPDGMCVLHKCDNPGCVNPEHLFLGYPTDNVADRDAKGRQSKGEGRPYAKLTEQDVIAIRNDDRCRKEIAADFGVHISNIYSIKNRTAWAHVA